jgi:hypothetical protein
MSNTLVDKVITHPLTQGASAVAATVIANPLVAGGIAGFMALLTTAVAQDQNEANQEFMEGLYAQVQTIQQKYIEESFFDSKDGRRIMANMIRAVRKDSRKEKIRAMIHLGRNLLLKSRLSVDEKELYVQTLDILNPFQLAILKRVVDDMRARKEDPHRGFGWETFREDYSKKGISQSILLQAIRVLESNGLVNANTATIRANVHQTHFISEFGEQFCDFCTSALEEDSLYLLIV